MAKNMKSSGITTSIVRPWAACLGSVAAGETIFCCTHMVAPTRIARKKSGTDRSIHRKLFSNGSAEYSTGQS